MRPARWPIRLIRTAAGMLFAAGAALQARPVVLQLKWYDQFQFAGYYAADHLGYFRQQGLEVELRPGGRGIDPVKEVVSGRATFGIGDSDLLLDRAKGEPVVVLATIFQHSPYIVLTRAQDRLQRPSDLAGKTIMALEDQGAAQLRAMLIREGIPPDRVRIVPHSWNLQDLASGKVDGMTAYQTVEPFQLRKLGVEPGILRTSDYGVDFYGDCLFTTEAEVRDHPEEVQAFLEATRKGWVEAMRDPDRVIPWILARPGVAGRGIGADNLVFESQAMQSLVLSDIVQVGHFNPDRWQQILRTYQDLGLVPRGLTLQGFLYEPPEAGISPRARRWIMLSLLVVALGIAGAFAAIATLRRLVRARTRELALAQHSTDQARDFISWVAKDGAYLYGNQVLLDLYGISLEELRRRKIWQQLPELGKQDWDRIWSRLQQTGSARTDAVLLAQDGREVPVEVVSSLVEAEGQLAACNIARDLTDFRRAEQEREERERQLALVLEGAGVGYWDWHVASGELDLDPTVDRMLGYLPGELPRRIGTWTEHLHPEDRPHAFGILQPFLDGREGIYSAEFRLSRKDGSWIWIQSRGRVAARGEDGQALRVQGILQDIDERKRTEAGLHQTQRLESLGLMAGSIAHDFNNLLTAVLGNLNLARMGMPEGARAAGHLAKAEEAVHQAAQLTRQLLAYSGKGRLAVEAIDLNGAVAQMQAILGVNLPKDAELEVRFGEPGPWLEGDRTQIHQVILNLVTNAAEALGGRAGRIRIATGSRNLSADTALRFPAEGLPPGAYATLEVSDTGQGMAPEVLARIFDPFFTTKATGRGLGLSAILGIMRAHRGGIQIESQPGSGTAFRLYFPIHHGPRPVAAAADASAAAPLQGMVLLADDEPAVLEAGVALLEALGFTVLPAADGEEAIARFLEHLDQVRLVILDQTMPRLSGTDAFRAIRRLRPGLPVILASGFSEEEVGDVLRAEGLEGFLQKPYRLADLERAVRKALGR